MLNFVTESLSVNIIEISLKKTDRKRVFFLTFKFLVRLTFEIASLFYAKKKELEIANLMIINQLIQNISQFEIFFIYFLQIKKLTEFGFSEFRKLKKV